MADGIAIYGSQAGKFLLSHEDSISRILMIKLLFFRIMMVAIMLVLNFTVRAIETSFLILLYDPVKKVCLCLPETCFVLVLK